MEARSLSQFPLVPMRNLTSGTGQSLPSQGSVYPSTWQQYGPIPVMKKTIVYQTWVQG